MSGLFTKVPFRQYKRQLPRILFVAGLVLTCAVIHFGKNARGTDNVVVAFIPELQQNSADAEAASQANGQLSALATVTQLSQPLSAAEVRQRVNQPGEPFLGLGRVAPRFFDLSELEAQGLFHSKMSNTAYNCTGDHLMKIKGRPKQPGTSYELCGKGPFALPTGKCLVYSFGVYDDWNFEDSLNVSHGCEIHSFDPRNDFSSITPSVHLNASNLYYHKMGLWGWNFRSADGTDVYDLTSIIAVLGHQNRVIDVLKLDLEGAEWPVLHHILTTSIHKQIKQLNLEIHAPRFKLNPLTGKEDSVNILDLSEIWQTMHDLERLGFLLYSNRPKSCCDKFAILRANPAVSFNDIPKCCYKVSYVNARFL